MTPMHADGMKSGDWLESWDGEIFAPPVLFNRGEGSSCKVELEMTTCAQQCFPRYICSQVAHCSLTMLSRDGLHRWLLDVFTPAITVGDTRSWLFAYRWDQGEIIYRQSYMTI
jgi:hypothetical protein